MAKQTVSPKRKREQLAAEILNTVPEQRLIAAMGFILRERHLRKHSHDTDTFGLHLDGNDINVQEFMQTCSLRQLRLLREIALGLDETIEPVH